MINTEFRVLVVAIAMAGVSLAAAPQAVAQEGPRASDQKVAPGAPSGVQVVILGASSGDEARTVADAALQSIRAQGLEPTLDIAPAAEVVEGLKACYAQVDKESCARAGSRGAQLVAIDLTGLDPDASGDQVSLTAWQVSPEGELLLAERRYCSPCDRAGLSATARELVGFLLRETTGTAVRSAMRIRTTPVGARVTVDGRPIGSGSLEYTVFPGRHQVTVDKPGYRIEVREVIAPPGATVDVEIALERDEPRDDGPSRALPIVIGGAGVLAVAAGVTLIAIHQPSEDGGQQVSRARNSMWPGVGVTAAGVALLGTSAWLWIRSGGDGEAAGEGASDKRAVVGISTDGAGLWVVGAGRF